MSQEKVDRYKEEKKNRQKMIKKQKFQSFLFKTAGVLVAVVLVGWIGYSVYDGITSGKAAESKTYSVNTAAVDDYLNGMSATESETESEEEAQTESETQTQTETETEPQTEAVTETQEAAETQAQ